MKLHSNQIHKQLNVMILLTTVRKVLQEVGWALVPCEYGRSKDVHLTYQGINVYCAMHNQQLN